MPKVHRFFKSHDIRANSRDLADHDLHVGIDLSDAGALFGSGWDREARDLKRHLHELGVSAIARGPAHDLPIAAVDPYVADMVRACHDRGLATATQLGAGHYLVRMGSIHGFCRSERLGRRDAASKLLAELALNARARGIRLVVQHHLEMDLDSLEISLDALKAAHGGIVVSPARALSAGMKEIGPFLDRCGEHLLGLDLSDLSPNDLEYCLPGEGILPAWPDLLGLLARPGLEFFCVDVPAGPSKLLHHALDRLGKAGSTLPAITRR